MTTLIDVYADGRLLKSKSIYSGYFMDDVPAAVATMGSCWILFFDSHPGAGDTWNTNYLVIRKRDLRFEQQDGFEHGDALHFQTTHRFYEYKYLKYQGDNRFQRLGVFGYKIVDWRWSERRREFRQVGQRFAPYLPRHLEESWEDPPRLRLHGALVGQIDYFRPANPSKFGVPTNSHFYITPWHGYGGWTVALVTGTLKYDEMHLL